MKSRLEIAIILFILVLCQSTYSQTVDEQLSALEKAYQDFNYKRAIGIAEKLLQSNAPLDSSRLVQIYEFKALSHYAAGDMLGSMKSFARLLELDAGYTPDPMLTPPKILDFFNQIKAELQSQPEPQTKPAQRDTIRITIDTDKICRAALWRSMILPGWGHLHLQHQKKGLLLTTLSSGTLAASLYFGLDCHDKRNLYLRETDPEQIQEKYSQYNKSYQRRNIALTSFALLWLYSQADLLFFENYTSHARITSALIPPQKPGEPLKLGLNYHF